MADDGMIMNFELGDAPLKAQTSFKGGSWKARLAATKGEKRRQSRGTAKPKSMQSREIFDNKTYANKSEEYIGTTPAERAPKRQRVSEGLRPVEGRNAATASVISGKLPPGSINLGQTGNKKVFGPEKEVEGRNLDTARHISGKLPPGSISLGNTGNKKVFGEGDEVREVESARHNAGKPSSDSANVGRNRDGPGGKPQQVIASLFTFNPAAKRTFEDEPTEEAEPAKPSNAPLTEEMANFVELGLSRRLAAHLSTKLEMKAPTAVQRAAIPQLIKEDDDVFIQAQTGSGKTLAYLLPIVERIMAMSAEGSEKDKIHRNSGLFAVVLAPTRELCKQISVVLEKLLRCASWIVSTTVIGGEGKKSEKARLRKGVNILIATPGRLADHLDNTEVLDVSNVRWLVLDEGDRLMELGFEEEIKGIVENIGRRTIVNVDKKNGGVLVGLPKRRVTVLCSATMKMNVQRLGEISLKDAVHVQAAISEEEAARNEAEGLDPNEKKFSAPAQLKQAYAIVPAKLRLVTLTAILKRTFARRGSVMKAIIFISCADSVDFHFSLFSRPVKKDVDADADEEESKSPPPTVPTSKGWELIKDTTAPGTAFSSPTNPVTLHRLHGSLAQNVRTATLKAFTESQDPCVLICTDVASRGLDLPNVDYVIEYDPPFSSDDHLHRVGRTARAGRDGRALIFLMPGDEEGYIDILASGYSDGRKSLTHSSAEELIRKGFGGTGREWEERATDYQLQVERWTLDSPKYLEMARRGYQSHIRAYATHVANERHIFNMQTMHLGHLAKAFALRDKPGSIKVPGLRPAAQTKAERSIAGRKRGKEKEVEKAPEGERVRKARKAGLDGPVQVDLEDASRRMRRKVKEHMTASAEFNIG